MCVAAGFYLPLRIFSCLTALAFLSLLLLDDEKEEKERERRNKREREGEKGEEGGHGETCDPGEEINARNRRDWRQEIEEKI